MKMTREEFNELADLKIYKKMDDFNKKLEELGIQVTPYVEYRYHCDGRYIGDSSCSWLRDILAKAKVEIE